MNRYLIIHRLRWPAFLLLTGVIALLDQAHVLSWGRGWPLYLILWGVLALAERATLAANGIPPVDYPYAAGYADPAYPAANYAAPNYPGSNYSSPNYPGYAATGPVAQAAAATAAPSTEIVPAQHDAGSALSQPRKSWEEEGR